VWESLTYEWELSNWFGNDGGTDHDLLSITGSLSLTGTTAGAYQLDIRSLTAALEPGDVAAFTETDRTWTILTTTDGIAGFDPSLWQLDTSAFTSDPDAIGTFSLRQAGNNLQLTYTVPEPSAALLLILTLAAYLLADRRRPRTR